MINRLYISNFKCFEALTLPLSELTLLTGFNAAGKSTALQTLLLLAQAIRLNQQGNFISLNGDLLQLGSPGDVVREGSIENITLGVGSGESSIRWTLGADGRNTSHTLHINEVAIITSEGKETLSITQKSANSLSRLLPNDANKSLTEITKSLGDLIYISAVRGGTPDAFPSPTDPSPVWADVGVQGEFASWWFEANLDEEIEPSRIHPSDGSPVLRRQFNAWANELFPGAQANAQRLKNTTLIQLELRNNNTENWRRPANIGYGLSYAFPILVAGLLAKPGQILVIDSPEAHLHPMAQSRIGQFLGTMAAAGVQIIVETHSDHVLNGIRIAIQNKKLHPEQASIHFFNARPRSSDDPAHVTSMLVDKEGNLSDWPSGFFDQAEKDLAALAGWN